MERTYYHDARPYTNRPMPDEENMLAYLLDEEVLYATSGKDANDEPSVALYILINDYFIPAADGEALPFEEVPKLFELYRQKKWDGVNEFVANKRGIPNKHWRDPDSDYQQSLKKINN